VSFSWLLGRCQVYLSCHRYLNSFLGKPKAKKRKERDDDSGGDSDSEGDGGDPTPIVPEESPYECGFPWDF
jgi:hypothetical protein